MLKKSLGGRTEYRPPATHRDEFPAEYSLAGCASAEPASAFSAMLILNQKLTRWLELFQRTVAVPESRCLNSRRSPVTCPGSPPDLPVPDLPQAGHLVD